MGLRRVPIWQREQTLSSDRKPGGGGLHVRSHRAVDSTLTELLPAPRGNIRSGIEDGFQSEFPRSDPGEGPERRVPQILLRLDAQDHGRAKVQVRNARNGRTESQTGCLAVAYSRHQGHRPRQAERAGELS